MPRFWFPITACALGIKKGIRSKSETVPAAVSSIKTCYSRSLFSALSRGWEDQQVRVSQKTCQKQHVSIAFGRKVGSKIEQMKNIGICLVLGFYCVAAFSQEVLDSVVYPEVKVEAQRISEAIGSNVSETDTILFRLMRFRGLTQILETESFISTRAYSPGGIANFSIRGSGAQHTQVVWNGIPINDPMLGQSDLSTISLSGISNVRVLYGPAGLTNNSGGIGGTIELIPTQAKHKNGLDGNVNISAGSFGTYGVSVQLRDRYKKLFGTTSFEYQTAKNNFTFTNLASIEKEKKELEHAQVKRLGFTKTIGVDLNERNTLSLNVYYARVRRELPPTMLVASTKETLFDRDIWAALKWRRIGKRSVINFTASYIYGKQEYSDNNEYTFHHLYQANKNLIRYKLNLGHNLHLELGGDVFTENAKSDSAYRNEPYWRYWQAAFASLKYVSKKWVAAQILLREDVIDGVFSPIQGLVGVEVKPTRWFHLKGNVSRNFRAATLDDLYWVPGGNPDLKSETGFSWEAGIGFKGKTKRFGFKLKSTYYNSDIKNWIIWLPAGNIWSPQNKRAVSSKGVETKLETTIKLGRVLLKFNAAHAWVRSRVTEGISDTDASVGKQLIYIPEHIFKTHLTAVIGNVVLTYGHQWTGIRYTTSDNESFLEPYDLGWMHASYRVPIKKHSIRFGATFHNIFNSEYRSIAWRPMPGRSFSINLNYKFL